MRKDKPLAFRLGAKAGIDWWEHIAEPRLGFLTVFRAARACAVPRDITGVDVTLYRWAFCDAVYQFEDLRASEAAATE